MTSRINTCRILLGICHSVGMDMGSQMSIFVGRRTHASAASSRDTRNLDDGERDSWSCWWASTYCTMESRSSRAVVEGVPSFWGLVVAVQCHGQLYTAMLVKVVSRQLDSVRVEQNHCHGLHSDNAS